MATRFSSPLRLVWGKGASSFPSSSFLPSTLLCGLPWPEMALGYLGSHQHTSTLRMTSDCWNVKTVTSNLAQEATKAVLQISGNKQQRYWSQSWTTWRRAFIDHFCALDIAWDEAEAVAANRLRWRRFLLNAPNGVGRSKSKPKWRVRRGLRPEL